jgi:hypothetical protein
MIKRIVWLPVLLALFGGQARSQQWNGNLSTLGDARLACSDTHSNECLPFLAQAVAVADVLQELSFVDMNAKADFVVVPFPHGNLTHCSQNWLKSMSGLALLHSTLEYGGFDDTKTTYWT